MRRNESLLVTFPYRHQRMRKSSLLLLSLLISLTSLAQTAGQNKRMLSEAIGKYFSRYTLPGYTPAKPMKADSFRIDEKARTLRIHTNEAFYSQPFTPESVERIRQDLGRALPQPYNTWHLLLMGKDSLTLADHIPNIYRQENEDRSRLWGNTEHKGHPWVRSLSRPFDIRHGLDGRHLMVWASHGRFYKNDRNRWEWQRPHLFCTTEDLFTQSFVYPFLYPMLENAGAIVCSPRERDAQPHEAITDNDNASGEMGTYEEYTPEDFSWQTAPEPAFAYPGKTLSDTIQPFRLGSARMISTTHRRNRLATATWTPDIPKSGRYAVYVSYVSRPNSVNDARYTVYHKGGRTQLSVNQQMGGGTWVYLGTYEFDAGSRKNGRVVLTNRSDYRGVVTADAVRFGGGMAQSPRGTAGTSGLPRTFEAARYYTQWAGLPDTLFSTSDGKNDYGDDIRCRSHMLNYLAGGSVFLPGQTGLGVPIEACLAIHSDAGIRKDGSVYGTLGICTTTDGSGNRHYVSGLSRKASSDLANILLTNVTNDLTSSFDVSWTRREVWDRNYGETRMPGVPAAILEMLSHQHYTDMKYGHDPNFKFVMARSIYKSLLRFVNHEHGIKHYAVQPLPVHAFAALLTRNGQAVQLTWQPTIDSLESSATPTGYVVYHRVGDGGFDNGTVVENKTDITLAITPGIRHDFKITAINQGGESFPSPILSVYCAPGEPKGEVLVVDGFERLSGPARIETADSLGFDLDSDIGVAYMSTRCWAGRQIGFSPQQAGREGVGSLGYCGNELTGKTIAGNTFDGAVVHGEAIISATGYSYSSCTKQALTKGDISMTGYSAVDYVAGLERDAPHNLLPYKSFSPHIQQLLTQYLQGGGRLMVSGAYIGSDMTSPTDSAFTTNVLKYRSAGTVATESDTLQGLNRTFCIYRTPCEEHYAAQHPDIIVPADETAFSAFAYANGMSAGTAYRGEQYRVLAMGFPFECIRNVTMRNEAMEAILRFLCE